jgi:diguanylate cyclase (GGDEF)-like protein/PAS domain S-box-containing protein
MKDKDKTTNQLINEVVEMRQQIAELKKLKNERKRMERLLEESEQRYKSLFEYNPDAVFSFDLDGNFLSANPACYKLSGYSVEELMHMSFMPLIGREDLEKTLYRFRLAAKGKPQNYETTIMHKDGHRVELNIINIPKFVVDGEIVGVYGIAKDITERKWAEKSLREREERSRRMLSAVTRYTYSVEVRGGHAVSTQHSIGCLPITGYHPEDYTSDPYLWYSMIHPDDRMMVENSVKDILSGLKVSPIEHRLFRRDGSVVWVRNTMVPHHNNKGYLIRYDGLIEDITERKHAEESLLALSLVDHLTGLYNRRGFSALAQQELKKANRIKRGMLLLFADVDDLKKINDSLGHQEGDLALIDTANLLKDTFREPDIIARIGGDEFVVLAAETPATSADILTARLKEHLKSSNKKGGHRYKLSISMGIVQYNPEQPCSIDELLSRADKMMYEQKRNKNSGQE